MPLLGLHPRYFQDGACIARQKAVSLYRLPLPIEHCQPATLTRQLGLALQGIMGRGQGLHVTAGCLEPFSASQPEATELQPLDWRQEHRESTAEQDSSRLQE